MKTFLVAACLTTFAGAAIAEGNAEAGKEQFNRQCASCHVVADASGNVLAGRNAKIGPNLFGVPGGRVAGRDDFRYGDSIVELGAGGKTWDAESFVGYVQDPTEWLRDELNNSRARGKMAYKVRSASDAADIYAYLETIAN